MALRNAPSKARQHSTQASDRELRPNPGGRKPILISSHPDPELDGLVPFEAPIQDDFRRGPDAERPKPIVSINGNDVEPEETDCNAA